uniref:Radical SAM protein n=1 Tax=candidate division WOR-3 bacterium TaxID=2052148 RepID=A0A7C6AF49_UNCW3
MIDILLVNPAEKGGFFEKIPPLGLASIAGFLETHNISVKIIDFEVEKKPLEHWLSLYQPKFLGISGTTHTRFESFRLARVAKSFNKDIITIYGGIHATFTANETLRNIPEIDFIIRGEGEETLLELLKTFSTDQKYEKIRGLSFRKDDLPVDNPQAGRLHLDSLPPPAYHLLDMKKYELKMEFVNKKGISILTSRGCLYRCSFCSASRMFNNLLTTRSANRVVDEIEKLMNEYNFQAIKFFDSGLTLDREHIENLCDEIINRNLKFPWECEICVGTVDQPMLEKMQKAGCYYVEIEVESASQKVLDLMRKGITVEQTEELLNMCKTSGIKTKAFFSFGHIGETMNDVEKTFEFMEKNSDKITTVASDIGVRIYPGTYLESYARKNRLLPDDFGWSMPYDEEWNELIFQSRAVPILIQPQLGRQDLEQIALRIYNKRLSGWEGFKKGITKLTDPQKLKKLQSFLKLKFKK